MRKRLYIIFAFFLNLSIVNAQRLIALEHNGTSSFYQYVDSAMAAAANGDNIYLPGGSVPLSPGVTSLIIDKGVHIYGTGYNPSYSGTLGTSQLATTTYILNTAVGGSLEGVVGAMLQTGNNSSNSNVINYAFRRCKFGSISLSNANGWTPPSNILISECIIGQLQSQNNPQSVIIEKCFIGNSQNPSVVSATTWSGVVFRNNIFYGKGFGGGSYMMSSFSNCIFQNNIIYNSANVQQWDITNCTITNNIFTCQQSVAEVGSGNSFTNNTYSQTLSSVLQNVTSNTYSFTDDYHLASGSVGIGAGTDGTDIGIYGTSSPFKDGGLPVNPHIISKSISTQTTGNGILQINISAGAQDN